jgi:RHS repeat-associated protein
VALLLSGLDYMFQEYRYDALNRRVFVSALFAPDCGSTCHDYTEQTIWDGDQVLGEIRTGGGFQQSGTVAYTHGGGLDAPLSLVRHGLTSGAVTIVPHSNWRGQYHAGSYTDGAVAGNSRPDLREVRWPAENAGAYLNPLRPFRRDAPWMGSLVQSSEDASGLMYRRNRYYDPKTGRFTQEDPIGLAGGLNTYGFADGDPVSYTDPYGLRAIIDDGCDPPGSCLARRTVQGLALGLAGGSAVAVACTVGTAGACALGPAEATVVATTGAGALAGAVVGTGEELIGAVSPSLRSAGARARRWATAVLLGLSAHPAVDTTPTNPCGDKIEVDCNGRNTPRDSVRHPGPPVNPPVRRNGGTRQIDAAQSRQNNEP